MIVISNGITAQTTLDDFTDVNYTSSPVWTVISGTAPSASTGALVTSTSTTAPLVISTPFTTASSNWNLTIKSSSSSNTDVIKYFFYLKDNSNPTNAASDGYYLQWDGNSGDYFLYRLDNGVATQLGTYNGTGSSATQTIVITQDATGVFTVTIGGTLRITSAIDNTYSPSSVQYQAFQIVENGHAGTYTIDAITYTSACVNPTSAGTIGNAQSSCGSFNPTALTSVSAASGNTGTLEYKWQLSTTSSSSGFSDIASSNATTYDPSTITQTTWYKRLSRVSCKADWTGAVTSNVIELAVVNTLTIDGNPANETIYNELGNGAFRASTNYVIGTSYQWQVSTNSGSSYSNISNNSYYSGVTDTLLNITSPVYAMNNYWYRCVATNSCNTVNSNKAILSVIPKSTYSNSTVTTCDTDFGTGYTFTRNITVSSLPTSLGTGASQTMLKQINLKLGNSSCTGDMSTYKAKITSPSGTVIELFNTFTANTNSGMWTNIKYRDDVSLEKVSEYTSTDQLGYHPHSIGYYAPSTDGSFSTVNGENPNGTWVLSIAENTSTEVTFENVDLIFEKYIAVNNLTGSTANNDCSSAASIGSDGIAIRGTNSGYSTSDPNYPGGTVSGCSWNGSNDNSAWFSFVASETTSYLTLSGSVATTVGGADSQPIIFTRSGGCSSGTFSVPTGGCPDDQSVNNTSYISPNGGLTSSNVYSNGISANTEFNLSGLTIGTTYYLYVDGNSSASSSFYIELTHGAQQVITPLPIDLLNFDGRNGNILYWSTASEINNDYFIIERSLDGHDWEYVNKVSGMGTYHEEVNYEILDLNYTRNAINYYRLTQVDYNGVKKIYTELIKAIDNRQGQNKEVVRITNTLGQEVDFNSSGVLILIYSDGTIKRILN